MPRLLWKWLTGLQQRWALSIWKNPSKGEDASWQCGAHLHKEYSNKNRWSTQPAVVLFKARNLCCKEGQQEQPCIAYIRLEVYIQKCLQLLPEDELSGRRFQIESLGCHQFHGLWWYVYIFMFSFSRLDMILKVPMQFSLQNAEDDQFFMWERWQYLLVVTSMILKIRHPRGLPCLYSRIFSKQMASVAWIEVSSMEINLYMFVYRVVVYVENLTLVSRSESRLKAHSARG